MLEKKFKMGIYFILSLLFQMFENFVTISIFCFYVQFLVKFCTNPLIPSGENYNYVFDIMSLGSVSMDV